VVSVCSGTETLSFVTPTGYTKPTTSRRTITRSEATASETLVGSHAVQPEASCPGLHPHGHISQVVPSSPPPTLKSQLCHDESHACSHTSRLGVSLAAAQLIAHDGT
jgi:hypothetical protein